MHRKYDGIIATGAAGKTTVYANPDDAARGTGKSRNSVYCCLWGKIKSVGGYTFRAKPVSGIGQSIGTRVIAKCKDGRAGKYNSVAEASLATGISTTAIFNRLKDGREIYGVIFERAK